MKQLFIGLLVAGVLPVAVSAAAEVKPAALEAMQFLVGHCWSAQFPDGSTDIHCYTSMYQGAFIRDRHLVRGEASDYRGETIYQAGPAAGTISYRYWNSLGGVSDGTLVATAAGMASPKEVHVGEDGSRVEIRSTMVREGEDRYVSVAEEKAGEVLRELWRMEFVKVGTADEAEPRACSAASGSP